MHNSHHIILFSFIFEIIIICSSFNVKKNYFIYTHVFILNLFSKRNECIF